MEGKASGLDVQVTDICENYSYYGGNCDVNKFNGYIQMPRPHGALHAIRMKAAKSNYTV